MTLTSKHCTACEGKVPPLKISQIETFLKQLSNGWKINKDHKLEKNYSFIDFKQALAFTNRLGALAEKEGHHPDIILSWGKVVVILWTHSVKGLTENDFILAAKADAAL